MDFITALNGTLASPGAGAAALRTGLRDNVDFATSAEAKSQVGDAALTVERAREQIIAGGAPIVSVTGTSRTVAVADNNCLLVASNASEQTFTLPADAPIGTGLTIIQWGAGRVALAAASGAFIRQADGYLKTRVRYSSVALTVIANAGGSAAEWLAVGDLAT